jgi:hypothetical protein
VEVSSLIAKLGELSEYHSSNKALFRAECIGEGGAWVLLENCSERIDYIKFLEDSVNAVIPLNFCLS